MIQMMAEECQSTFDIWTRGRRSAVQTTLNEEQARTTRLAPGNLLVIFRNWLQISNFAL